MKICARNGPRYSRDVDRVGLIGRREGRAFAAFAQPVQRSQLGIFRGGRPRINWAGAGWRPTTLSPASTSTHVVDSLSMDDDKALPNPRPNPYGKMPSPIRAIRVLYAYLCATSMRQAGRGRYGTVPYSARGCLAGTHFKFARPACATFPSPSQTEVFAVFCAHSDRA